MLNITDLGEGTPILWIHGFPLASSIYERQLTLPHARHVIPDLPGFGQSPPPEVEISIDDYARLMLDVLDERSIDRAVVAGLSMGGYICFALARIAPERVRGLILIDTRETPDDDAGRKGRFESIDKVRTAGVQPIVDTMLPKMLTAGAPQEVRERVREIMTSASPAGVTTALKAMAERPDSSNILRSIDVPTLIVVGKEDPITPPADASRMAAAMRNATLVEIPDAAHLSNYEQPDAFNAACAQFLAQFE